MGRRFPAPYVAAKGGSRFLSGNCAASGFADPGRLVESDPAVTARHRPLRLCDAKFGRAVLSGLYDNLHIVPQCYQETHEALHRISPELTGQHS